MQNYLHSIVEKSGLIWRKMFILLPTSSNIFVNMMNQRPLCCADLTGGPSTNNVRRLRGVNRMQERKIYHRYLGIPLQLMFHYNDTIMSKMATLITSLTIVCSIVYSGEDQRKHQTSASLALVRRIHQWPVNSPHKGPVTRKIFPFYDVIMRVLEILGKLSLIIS